MLASGAGAARFMSDLQSGGLLQGADERALAELDLETIVFAWARLGEGGLGRRGERVFVKPLALEPGFGLLRPPRHRGDAAERDTCVLHGVAVEIQRHGGRR